MKRVPIPAISLYGLEVADAVTPTLFANTSEVLSHIPGDLLAQVESHALLYELYRYVYAAENICEHR